MSAEEHLPTRSSLREALWDAYDEAARPWLFQDACDCQARAQGLDPVVVVRVLDASVVPSTWAGPMAITG